MSLERFVEAQRATHHAALAELRRGRKTGHWMWWEFPQLASLGRSPTAKLYGLSGVEEAAAYLAHPVLGPRLLEAVRAMLGNAGRPAEEVLGPVDALKLRSCASLFARVPGAPPEFLQILNAFHDGQPDAS